MSSDWQWPWSAVGVSGSLNAGKPHVALWGPAQRDDLYFDLASLSKVFCTSSLLMQIYVQSTLEWERFLRIPMVDHLPELRATPFEALTLGELWEHRSGMPAWKACFSPARKACVARDFAWAECLRSILDEEMLERGQTVYSDLGFLLLGLFLERREDCDIREQWLLWKKARAFESSMNFVPATRRLGERLMPTETRHGPGEVNDDNAASLGGIAPHAGLFGSCMDAWEWLRAVQRWRREEPRVEAWLRPRGEARFHGGWDRPQGADSQGGGNAPPGTLGHLGYTGTALWWHPESGRAGVLLSNRVHPAHSEANQAAIKKMRQDFFTSLWARQL